MNIATVVPGYLFAIKDIFPEELIESINRINWAERAYDRLTIGRNRRRLITYNDSQDQQVNDYCFDVVKTQIEEHCQLKFIKESPRSFGYWLDEPRFKPSMHTDGDLPSALQIYLQSDGNTELGTAFYHPEDQTKELHYFSSQPNTGYIMLNQPEPGRPLLWHNMRRAVPFGRLRLSLYVTFGRYARN
jgi:hypothetical protein